MIVVLLALLALTAPAVAYRDARPYVAPSNEVVAAGPAGDAARGAAADGGRAAGGDGGTMDVPSARAAFAFARDLALAGPRPAGSAAERRAHRLVARRFEAAGLTVVRDRFAVPGVGRSRNVIGVRRGTADCLKVVMAHADSDPPAPGADDNASGVGALVALAPAVDDACDVWLVATGAEERGHTGLADHQGALALARRLTASGRDTDVRFALSLDEVGRGASFWLRSPAAAPRRGVERSLLRAARAADVPVRWVPDETGGNSDHRELELAGMPAMKLGVPDDPCRHTACDTADRLQRGAFYRALQVVHRLLS